MAGFYTTAQLGPKQELTPEGFLLCRDVPIARTGMQIYRQSEFSGPGAPIGDRAGFIKVFRHEDQVFDPETMASFEGKSITVGHPRDDVDPKNYRDLEVGTMQNIRRSTEDASLLLADFLVKDHRTIDQIKSDPENPYKKLLREVSCGYSAQYYQDVPGIAEQRRIRGNHGALVPKGRAGPICSIQDEDKMSNKTSETVVEKARRVIAAIKSGDVAAMRKTADEMEDGIETEDEKKTRQAMEKTSDDLAKLTKTVDSLAEVVGKLAELQKPPEAVKPAKTADELAAEQRTADQAMAAAAFKASVPAVMAEVGSRAEILVPGIQLPAVATIDSAEALAAARRTVLTSALATEAKAVITPLLGARTVDALTPFEAELVFNGAAEMMRLQNNARGTKQSQQKTGDSKGKIVTPADMNKLHAEFWTTH